MEWYTVCCSFLAAKGQYEGVQSAQNRSGFLISENIIFSSHPRTTSTRGPSPKKMEERGQRFAVRYVLMGIQTMEFSNIITMRLNKVIEYWRLMLCDAIFHIWRGIHTERFRIRQGYWPCNLRWKYIFIFNYWTITRLPSLVKGALNLMAV